MILVKAHYWSKLIKSHRSSSNRVELPCRNDNSRGSSSALVFLDVFVISLLLVPNSSTGIALTFLALG